jgi:hypothetical protein
MTEVSMMEVVMAKTHTHTQIQAGRWCKQLTTLPLFPAAITTRKSVCSYIKRSTSEDEDVYSAVSEPHELLQAMRRIIAYRKTHAHTGKRTDRQIHR